MVMKDKAELAFHAAMQEIYRRVVKETGYKPFTFLKMLAELGGLGTAQQLIHAAKPSDGYTELHLKSRLDLTVERECLKQAWKDLFTDEDRAIARARLVAYGYDFTTDKASLVPAPGSKSS